TWYAHSMVWKWGMGPSGLIGNYTMIENMREDYGSFRGEKSSLLSEELKEQLNSDVQKILNECLGEVEDLLKREDALLERFAQELLNKDELNYDEIEAIFKDFGKARPCIS
ncbi:MAG: hypothetical protein PHY88_01440, partial [Candidatus Omnitrophica bacterium]|nr:hypothetical protein [Candidatus Omnitrophota bacterium]